MLPKAKGCPYNPKAKKLAPFEFRSSSNSKQARKTSKDVLPKEQSYFHKEHLEHVLTPLEDSQWQDDAWYLKERYLVNQNYKMENSIMFVGPG